jgi:chemotaxis signal transduction protein
MVIQVDGCTFAISVDEVREVQQIAADQVQPLQVTKARYAAGEVTLDGTPMPLMDISAMVRAVSAVGESK